MKIVALFILLVASSVHSLPSVANVTHKYIGAGKCLDQFSRSYDYLAWEKSDFGTVQDCANHCNSTSLTVGSPCLGFFVYEASASSSSNWCFCQYSDTELDQINVSNFTPPAATKNTNGDAVGEITIADGSVYNCYSFASGCDVRVLAALDRTYADDAVNSIDTASEMLGLVLDNFEFGTDAAFGVLDLMQHSVDWVVDFSNPAATDKALLQQRVSKISGAWRHRATNFWKLFTGTADVVADPNVSSYIIIFSDGRLLHKENWKGQARRLKEMSTRLGADMPKILCFRTRIDYNEKFFSEVCKEVYYVGKGGKTKDDIAKDIVNEMCSR